MNLSIIVPVYNESESIVQTLLRLQSFRGNGNEVIVVDGGSSDDTVRKASPYCDQVLITSLGRARQMNKGADRAKGDVLVFLHADTLIPETAADSIVKSIEEGSSWGRFNVCLSGKKYIFRVIETLINWRSCLTSIATGDQVVFVKATVFRKIGGYPMIPLMEDVALSKLLKVYGRADCLKTPVITSSRRWEEKGIFKTVILMWWLRLMFFIGVSPQKLYRHYYG